jgi:hypothetical protein
MEFVALFIYPTSFYPNVMDLYALKTLLITPSDSYKIDLLFHVSLSV